MATIKSLKMKYLSLEQIEEQALKQYPMRHIDGLFAEDIKIPSREDRNYSKRYAYIEGMVWMQRRLSELNEE